MIRVTIIIGGRSSDLYYRSKKINASFYKYKAIPPTLLYGRSRVVKSPCSGRHYQNLVIYCFHLLSISFERISVRSVRSRRLPCPHSYRVCSLWFAWLYPYFIAHIHFRRDINRHFSKTKCYRKRKIDLLVSSLVSALPDVRIKKD